VKRGTTVILTAIVAAAAPREAVAQSDPRLVGAVRQAQAGQVDSARAMLRRLASTTPASDQLYPEILYSIALAAVDVTERERNLQRVTVEYPLSPWADDALLLLAQSDYAGGNLPGTARDLERLRRDYAASPRLPEAAVWAARTYFDMRNQRAACDWVLAGLRRRDADAETHDQLRSQLPRCGALIAASDTMAPAVPVAAAARDSSARDTTPASTTTPSPTPAIDTTRAAVRPDTTRVIPRADTANTPTDTVKTPSRPAGNVAATPSGYRVQLAAAATRNEADAIVRGLASRGIDADVVEEKGYFKVRTGHFAARREAQLEANRLRARLGNGAFVVSQ